MYDLNQEDKSEIICGCRKVTAQKLEDIVFIFDLCENDIDELCEKSGAGLGCNACMNPFMDKKKKKSKYVIDFLKECR